MENETAIGDKHEFSLPWTGERFVPSLQGSIYYEHLHRYALALELVAERNCLDIACGEGFGSSLLARKAKFVWGVDIDESCIHHASKKYVRNNLKFLAGSATKIPMEDNSVDVVVSFETIEHFGEHDNFMREISRVLKPDGFLIISSPDKSEYSDKTGHKNSFHVAELYHSEFNQLLKRYFSQVKLGRQRLVVGSYILDDGIDNKDSATCGVFSGSIKGTHFEEGLPNGIYSIAICSNQTLPQIKYGLFEDSTFLSGLEAIQAKVNAKGEAIRQDQLLAEQKAATERAQNQIDNLILEKDGICHEHERAKLSWDQQLTEQKAATERAQSQIDNLVLEKDRLCQEHEQIKVSRDQQLTEQKALTERAQNQIDHLILEKNRLCQEHEQAKALWNQQLAEQKALTERTQNQIDRLMLEKNRLCQEHEQTKALWNQQLAEQKALTERTQNQIDRLMLEKNRLCQEHEQAKAFWNQQLTEQKAATEKVLASASQEKAELGHALDEIVHELEQVRQLHDLNVPMPSDFEEYIYTLIPESARKTLKKRKLAQDIVDLKNSSLFDPTWYLAQNPDVSKAGVDPATHYVLHGEEEGRRPAPHFKIDQQKLIKYRQRAFTGCYFVKYLRQSLRQDGHINTSTTPSSVEHALVPHSNLDQANDLFVAYQNNRTIDPAVKLIAFYLPQFHPFPENDAWWGKGFTEWTNVGKAQPVFHGHHQPHCPIHLGYYDLRVPEVMQEQARLAKQYGVHGFSYYFYWFNGKILMHTPLEMMLRNPEVDIPFCLTWANENWTRRWDGYENEILIAQKHSYEDSIAFLKHIVKYFKDKRYITIDGKPVLIIYRASIIPNIAETAQLWRDEIVKHGFPGIYLICAKSFGILGPEPFGFDASVEFPPHHSVQHSVQHELQMLKPDFKGGILSYDKIMEGALASEEPSYKLFRTAMLSWDNTARKQNDGTIIHGFSLPRYKEWLSSICDRVYRNPKYNGDEKLVFVNAWNEWAEGAHLEPDRKFGYGYLQTTYEIMKSYDKHVLSKLSVLVIGHDTFPAGAQVALLETLSEWKRSQPFNFRLILVNDNGELRKRYEELCPLLVLSDYSTMSERNSALEAFLAIKPDIIYSNTSVNGPTLRDLTWLRCPVVTHVHELQKSIERWAPGEVMQLTLQESSHFIACGDEVRQNLIDNHRVEGHSITTILASINLNTPQLPTSERKTMMAELALDDRAIVIMGCGTTDWRKGPDLFIQVAALARVKEPRLRFIWIGAATSDYLQKNEHVQFIGERINARNYFSLGHVFLLTSREDPFPLVVLEAAAAGLPSVCFENAGGIPKFVENEAGLAVPFENVAAAADALLKLAANEELRTRLGANARKKVLRNHSSAVSSYQTANLLRQLVPGTNQIHSRKDPLISIIVPNYNHSRYLAQRLESIRDQTISDYEVILLDDCSPDGSLAMLKSFARIEPRSRLVANQTNQGTFRQWKTGLSQAKGKYIWIAESDDASEPDFLESLIDKLEKHSGASLAYSASRMIDENGHDLGLPWDWLEQVDPYRWRSDYLATGIEEINIALLKQNTILNASSVVIRNFPGIEKLIEENMRLCADWLFWIRLCEHGEIAYNHMPLNLWRQGSSNARSRPPGELEWIEGETILSEASRIALKSPDETKQLLASFKNRCNKWADEALTS